MDPPFQHGRVGGTTSAKRSTGATLATIGLMTASVGESNTQAEKSPNTVARRKLPTRNGISGRKPPSGESIDGTSDSDLKPRDRRTVSSTFGAMGGASSC